MTDEEQKLWDSIIDDLRGQCQHDLFTYLDNDADLAYLANNREFLRYFDNNLFVCDECGWTIDISEIGDDNECIDCEQDNMEG
tara:strand:- start:1154 stop:1402 length:249 start_codon:yes stop_codon:yes gene_type:complete